MKIEARASALLLLAAVPAVQAQSDGVAYPSRPIRIIVPLAEFAAHVRSEFDRWRKIIRDANVSVK